MKFAFISPGANIELSLTEKSKVIGSWPPLGILYIATILRREGIEVALLDQAAQGYNMEQTIKWVQKEAPDMLGFSALASSGMTAARIAKRVKEYDPNITIIFGNYYATFNDRRILTKYPQVDIIIRGEGEETTKELIETIQKRSSLKKVKGITFRAKGKIINTPDRPLIKDVDSLPIPNRTLLDVEYHSTLLGAIGAPKRFTTLLSSRGCPYRCRFCGCQSIVHGTWRPRSVENTFTELELLRNEGYRQFLFVDDSFTINQKRIIELCRKIIKERLDIEWICEGRVNHASYELMRSMVKAGCKIIYFGIESANQRILDYYQKQITSAQSRKAVGTARKAGMDIIVGSFIVGAPTETRQEIENTLKFSQEIPLDVPQYNILGLFPGMAIWDEAKMKGYLTKKLEEEHWEMGIAVAKIFPNTVHYEEIKNVVRHYYRQFFIHRPNFLLTQIARTMKSSFRLDIIKANLNRIGSITRGWKDFVAFEGKEQPREALAN
ncbi:MAG: cobalamin-dependent protein [Candidatus Bathyarchaeota archaeon]|nr:MAG: cobalamin-dependent protein [Candidatus Bathyarchaeota archaeon]